MNRRQVTITVGAVVEKPKTASPHDEILNKPMPVLHFAFCPDLEDGGREVSVKAANLARGIMSRIAGDDPDGIMEGWPSESEWWHLWHIDIKAEAKFGNRASIEADYHAMPCCPLSQRQSMMEVYRALQTAMRKGRAK